MPLFCDVWYIIGDSSGWDGVQNTHWALGWKLGENFLALGVGIGMGETGIGPTLVQPRLHLIFNCKIFACRSDSGFD